MVKGYRNNNPGNIRRLAYKNGKPQYWYGEIPYEQSEDLAFSQFVDMKVGLRALFKLIYNHHKGGNNTVQKLISKYAPPNENDTQLYIKKVSEALGISSEVVFKLTYENIFVIAKAANAMENYQRFADLLDHSDYEEAFAISGIPLKKKLTK